VNTDTRRGGGSPQGPGLPKSPEAQRRNIPRDPTISDTRRGGGSPQGPGLPKSPEAQRRSIPREPTISVEERAGADMPLDSHQVPPGADGWEVEARHFLVWYVPCGDPPVPLAWFVSSSAERQALGIDTNKIDRKFKSWDQFSTPGVLRHGGT